VQSVEIRDVRISQALEGDVAPGPSETRTPARNILGRREENL
jgi:hypothetical protein